MNNKGQAVLSEYVMIFFVVIAAVAAMTTFVQRGIQARVHDARNFMINAVTKSGACDADCMRAAGGRISYEYEPYYAKMLSDVTHNEEVDTGARPSSVNWSIGSVYTKSSNEATTTTSKSTQLPARCVNGGC